MRKDAFPGVRIEGKEVENIIENIFTLQNPNHAPTTELIKSWTLVKDVKYALALLNSAPEHYIYYEHPVHKYLNKLYLVQREDLLPFFEKRINPEKMEGLDVTLASADFSLVIVCNHDGDIFLVKH